MLPQKPGIWRDRVVGELERLSLVRFERLLHGVIGQKASEAGGEEEAEIVVEGDEALVECGIVEAVECNAVADVEAFCFVVAPREDVRCDEEFADGQAGDGAAVVVVVEHGVAEVALAAPLFGRADGFGGAGGWSSDAANPGARDDFGGFVFRIDEQAIEAFLTERDELGGRGVEFVPDFAVVVARALKPLDPTQLECWVERCEVAQLHRHRAWRAPDPGCEVDDHGLPLVELSEAELMIEVEDDEKLVFSPSFSGSHGLNLRSGARFTSKN